MSLTSRRQLLGLLACTAASIAVSAPSFAHPPIKRPPPPSSQHSVQIEDAFGRSLPTYSHRGDRFVLGRWGDRYQLRIRNDTARRVEAVVTVDGRDVISGEPGGYAHRGYIVPAYGSVLITGFRQSLQRAAAFRFTDPSNSYSARTGTPQNVGVVGVAIFPEMQRPQPDPPYRYRSRRARPSAKRANPNPRASEGAPSDQEPPVSSSRRAAPHRESRNNLGTEYGESTTNYVVERKFTRARSSYPDRVLSLRYDDEQGLRSRGIRVWRDEPITHTWDREPDPFPERRFAPPPPR